jgi:Zn-dependent protease with chaperone function
VLTYLGQTILHAIIAAAFVEALLRVWRIGQPDARLTCRLVALVLPLVALPAFYALVPFRFAPAFAERWALLSISRWDQVRVAGIGLDIAAITCLGSAGIALFLFDALPALRLWLIDRSLPLANDPPCLARLAGEATRLKSNRPGPAPAVRLVDSRSPVLMCSGLVNPRLVVSTGAVESLDERQLRAGLAHELAHAEYHDPRMSWALMAVRALFFYSPATQVVARAAVAEMERRADDRSVSVTDDRFAMAGALVKLYAMQYQTARGSRAHGASLLRRAASWLHTGRAAAVERRCRRLLSPDPRLPLPFRPFLEVLAGVSLFFLLFFVV